MSNTHPVIDQARRQGAFISIDLPRNGAHSSPIIPIVGWIMEGGDDVWFEANGRRIDYVQTVSRPAVQDLFPPARITGFDFWIDAHNYMIKPSRTVHIVARNRQTILGERYVNVVPADHEEASQSRLTFFLHVVKTAGTALRLQMYRSLGTELVDALSLPPRGGRILPAYLPTPLIETLTPRGLSRYDIVIGHFRYNLHKITDRPHKYITVLRNPYDFLISLYFHHKTSGVEMEPLYKFINSLDLGNHFCRTICGIAVDDLVEVGPEHLAMAIENIEKDFSFVGLTDQLGTSARRMSEILGMDLVTGLRPENVTPVSPERDAIDRAAFERVAFDRVRFDLDLVNYVRRRFFEQ